MVDGGFGSCFVILGDGCFEDYFYIIKGRE